MIRNLARDFAVYIHVDKKSSINIKEIEQQNVHVYKKYKVYWGSYNMIRSTLFLFSKAHESKAERYIFISGADVPLKTNEEIKRFFESTDKEYFSYEKMPITTWGGKEGGFERVDYFYLNQIQKRDVGKFKFFLYRCARKAVEGMLNPLMKTFHIRRLRLNINYYKGANWMNLSDKCVSCVLHFIRENPSFVKKFRWTSCVDEIFFQTLILNFVKDVDVENDTLRFIDWSEGTSHPYVFREADYKRLKERDELFARKFQGAVDSKIIDMLYRDIGYK